MTKGQFSLIAKCGLESEGGPVLNAQRDTADYSLLEIAESLIKQAGWRVDECVECSPDIYCSLRNLATTTPETVIAMINNQLSTLNSGTSQKLLS